MLESIYNVLKTIGDFFGTVGEWIVNLVKDIVKLVELTANAVGNIPKYLSWLPAPVLAIALVIFSIVVLYKVLGREG